MIMVILGNIICLTLGACIGFIAAGICTTASDKKQPGAETASGGRGWG
jgi:hypothetical protein